MKNVSDIEELINNWHYNNIQAPFQKIIQSNINEKVRTVIVRKIVMPTWNNIRINALIIIAD